MTPDDRATIRARDRNRRDGLRQLLQRAEDALTSSRRLKSFFRDAVVDSIRTYRAPGPDDGDVPRLLDALEQAEAENERLRNAVHAQHVAGAEYRVFPPASREECRRCVALAPAPLGVAAGKAPP